MAAAAAVAGPAVAGIAVSALSDVVVIASFGDDDEVAFLRGERCR